MAEVEALLFDLGGVVVEIDFDLVLRNWEPLSSMSFDELKETFWFDEPYQRHERGEIEGAEYFAHIRETLGLDGSDEEIIRGWNSVFVGTIPEALEAIREARAQYPCFAISNTNPTHKAAWDTGFPEIFQPFDRIFVSHELGLRKPEPECFRAIAAEVGHPLEKTLFFDDTGENIAGAEALGMPTVLVRSAADVVDALTRLGAGRSA